MEILKNCPVCEQELTEVSRESIEIWRTVCPKHGLVKVSEEEYLALCAKEQNRA